MLSRVFAQLWKAAPALLVVSFFYNLLALSGPIYMVQVYERVLASRQVETLILLTVMVAAAIAVYALLDAVRSWMLQRLAAWMETEGFRHVFSASLKATLAGSPQGAQPMRDLAEIQSFVASTARILLDLPFAPLFFVVAFILHPWIGWLTVAAALILFGLALLNDRATRGAAARFSEAARSADQLVEHSLNNAETLRGMGMERAVADRWRRLRGPAEQRQQHAQDVSTAFSAGSKFVRTLSQSLVLGLGALLVIGGELSVGLIIAGTIVLGRALGPIDQILSAWRSLLRANIALQRLMALDRDAQANQRQTMTLPAPVGRIELDGVSYRPKGARRDILSDVAFDVDPGSTLAIVGPSGAGKSTIIRLLTGAIDPTAGALLIDGHDAAFWNREALGRHVGYVPQDISLFPGTIRENIARMDEKPDDDEVFAAAELAGLRDVVNGLADGFDTAIGPGGGFLSGGQRQRVALARALYKRPPIIVLDEPDAHLDQPGERILRDAIASAQAWDAAVVVVTHKPSLVHAMDRILVIFDGKVRAFGPPSEAAQKLLARSGAPQS